MNIVLVAEESAGVQALRLISENGHTPAGVLTSSMVSATGTNIAGAAKHLGVSVLSPERVKDPSFASWIRENEVDILLNVHALHVICPEVIQAVRIGSFNLHPGPLPQYAGLNAPSWAIYHGETHHAVTLHRVTNVIDAGDIIYEATFPLSAADTGLTVSTMCVRKGLPLIQRLLEDVKIGPEAIPGRAQDLTLRKYYKRDQIPGNGYINWAKSARRIDAFVRACNYSPFPSPWGHSKTKLGEKEISIPKLTISNRLCSVTPGTVGESIQEMVAIATADQWVLIDRCLVNGVWIAADKLLKPGNLLSAPVHAFSL